MTGWGFIIAACTLTASALFLARRGLRYLQFFQQEGYDGSRFIRWYTKEKAFDRRGTLGVIPAVVFMLLVGYGSILAAGIALLVAFYLCIVALSEPDPRLSGKLPLNMTSRATRIFAGYLLLITLLLPLAFFIARASGLSFLVLLLLYAVLFQAAPFLIVAANSLLRPYEEWTQRRYLHEAKKRLARIDPYLIGITGSYGKTTTKNILGQILQGGLGSTFWPEKGINTPMGITRAIRTALQPHHKYAVVEMGAYRIGSIKRLCDLAPPDAAIITAVGIMHLDRFDGVENIYRGKSELAAAVPASGILVCNGDNEGARRMAQEFKKETTLLYGLDSSKGHLDCIATNVTTVLTGTEFTVHWQGQTYPVRMPLFGLAAVSNVLGAFAMSCALGMRPEYVVALIASLEQVENRLFLDTQNGIHYFRDAYNSNPTGFRAALDVLAAYPAKRRIVITPGMIELGEKQYAENKQVAARAAEVCDLVYIVSDLNRAALLEGLQEGGLNPESVHIFADRTAAFAALTAEQRSGDAILIENDLPDVLETREHF